MIRIAIRPRRLSGDCRHATRQRRREPARAEWWRVHLARSCDRSEARGAAWPWRRLQRRDSARGADRI